MSLPSTARATTRRLSARADGLAAAPPPAAPLLRLSAVRCGKLRGLTLEVAAGEWVTLLGPAGAGKATALRVVAGLLAPEAGEVAVHGRVLPPGPGRFPLLCAQEEPAPHARAWLGFGKPADRPKGVPFDLAAWRMALAAGPELLLLDDIAAPHDPTEREALVADLRAAARQYGAAVLHATRDPALALALADRIAVLAGGTVRQVGAPADVYDAPADAVVARALGECNLLPGTVLEVEDGIARVALAGGAVVESLAGGPTQGAACLVGVRPERVALAAEELGAASLPARVLAVGFRGDHTRVTLEIGTAPGLGFVVRRPAAAAMAGVAPGEIVSLAWQPHHARALPA